MICVDLRTNRE